MSLEIIGNTSFALAMQLKTRHNFKLKCPIYKLVTNKFSSIFKNVVSRNLKSFFQSFHQVGICLYLIEATTIHHSKKLGNLKPP